MKIGIRREVKIRTSAMTAEEFALQSGAVCSSVSRVIEALNPSVLALFLPLSDEVDISPLLNRFSCRIVVPRVAESGFDMNFYDYSADNMEVGAYGIVEPQGGEPCRASDIDVMIVPGVAFTPDGARLGRGKGYYDRYMSQHGFRAYKIGVCFAHQIYDELPVEPHDCCVDRVICG